MFRCFYGLRPAIKDRKFIQQWRNNYLHDAGKPVIIDNFHITLAFLANINEQQLHNLLKQSDKIQCPPIDITLNTLGYWAKPKVLYLGTNHCSSALLQLAQYCAELATHNNIAIEQRPYIPHLTLSRKATKLPYLGDTAKQHCDFNLHFHSFNLYLSTSTPTGVVYQVLKSWSLQNTG